MAAARLTMAFPLCLGVAGAAAAADLRFRPEDAAGLRARIDDYRADGPVYGWNALLSEELLAHTDYAAAGGPWLAVTGAPYLATTFFLDSRVWAQARSAGETAAEARFLDTIVAPSEGLVFKLSVIAEDERALRPEACRVTYTDDAGGRLPVAVELLDVESVRTTQGSTSVATAMAAVDLPTGYEWSAVDRIGLDVSGGGPARYRLEWSLPDGEGPPGTAP